jgi:hypothetical protein
MSILQQTLPIAANKFKWYISFVALAFGSILFFLAGSNLAIWLAQQAQQTIQAAPSQYLVINKTITDASMAQGQVQAFTAQDIENLKSQKFIQTLAPITAARFQVSAQGAMGAAFYTQLFLESVPNKMLDVDTSTFNWQQGQTTLPIILNEDYLNLYNYGFALSQGLPQVSQNTIKAIPINITIAGNGHTQEYIGQVTGFSKQISSILVPQQFMSYANNTLSTSTTTPNPSRLIIGVTDPTNPQLTNYLNQNNLSTPQPFLNTSKIRHVLNITLLAVSLLGLFFVILSLTISIIMVQLLITQHTPTLKLLSIQGYAHTQLAQYFYTPIKQKLYISISIATVLALIIQLLFVYFLQQNNIPVTYTAALISLLSIALLSSYAVLNFFKNRIHTLIHAL